MHTWIRAQSHVWSLDFGHSYHAAGSSTHVHMSYAIGLYIFILVETILFINHVYQNEG